MENQTNVALVALGVLLVAALGALWHPWSPEANSVAPSPSPQGVPSVVPSVASPPALGGVTCVTPGLSEPQCAAGSQLVKAIGSDGCVSSYSCAPSMELLVQELGQMQLPECTGDAAFADAVQACNEKPNSAFSFIRDADGCIVSVNCTTIG